MVAFNCSQRLGRPCVRVPAQCNSQRQVRLAIAPMHRDAQRIPFDQLFPAQVAGAPASLPAIAAAAREPRQQRQPSSQQLALACAAASLLLAASAPPPAALASPEVQEPAVFGTSCAGCHAAGGNVVRRDATLSLADMAANGIDSEQAVYKIIAKGRQGLGGGPRAPGRRPLAPALRAAGLPPMTPPPSHTRTHTHTQALHARIRSRLCTQAPMHVWTQAGGRRHPGAGRVRVAAGQRRLVTMWGLTPRAAAAAPPFCCF